MTGNEVKTILKTNGFQLKQVADRMGVSPQNLDEKLKVKQIKIDTLKLIAEAIEKPIDFFLDLSSENQGLSLMGTIPLLPISAQGGALNEFMVSVKEADCEQIISPIRGVDFAITVSGESMYPEYPNGSQILVKRINEKAFIDWGRVYVLDTVNGTVIKRIVPADEKHNIRCLSINPDPIYAPFDVALSDVYAVYRVLMCMSMK